jgi:hypothetical protein
MPFVTRPQRRTMPWQVAIGSTDGRAGTCARPLRLLAFLLLVVALLPAVPTPAVAADGPRSPVLVFGEEDNGYEVTHLVETLTSLGYGVDRSGRLPTDLSGYEVIWHVEAYRGLATGEPERLAAFVQSGGGLYLTGERPCCEELNESVQRTLQLAGISGVQVGGLGDIAGPFTFNANAVGGIAQTPNVLLDFVPDSPGGMDGIGGVGHANVFASNGQIAVGAAWDADSLDGAGRIALLMDIDYLGKETRRPIIQNIQNFLEAGAGCSDDGHWAGFAWAGPSEALSPPNCTSLLTPTTIEWAAASDEGPVTIEVRGFGFEPDCEAVQVGASSRTRCALPVTSQTATLAVTATDARGSTTRRYQVRPKNDSRNVPVPFGPQSNWWDWPDRDGDGIPDVWEERGVWVDGTWLNLPGLGADPDRKDLFLHYEFEEGTELDEAVFDHMRAAFADSPLTNPDGSTGVDLHVHRGPSIPASIVAGFELAEGPLRELLVYSGFARLPHSGGSGVPQLFNYMVNLEESAAGGNIIGQAYIKGNFGWTAYSSSTMQKISDRLRFDIPGNGEAWIQATNATHELGHQLGLHHHGRVQHPESDRNYRSVMSYAYNVFGIPDGLRNRIDYSRVDTPNLDWRMGRQMGAMTFVRGQHGEVEDFYLASNDAGLQILGSEPTDPHTLEEQLAEVVPESLHGFAADFEVDIGNAFPTAADVAATVQGGSSVEIELLGEDPDGEEVEFHLVSDPEHGTATVTGSSLTYTAELGGRRTELLTYRAYDGVLSSEPATITVTIEAGPPVDPPVDPPVSGPTPPTCADARPASFRDVDASSTHGRNIVCSAGLDLVTGKGDGTYDPTGSLTRGQTATILLRALERSGVRLTAEQGFSDVPAGHPHGTAIRKLAAAGVINGRSAQVFDPSGSVTRAQFAALLDRASTTYFASYPDARNPFRDVSGVHEPAIRRLAGAEVIKGTSATTFEPGKDINRAQAASLFVRWLEDQAQRMR